MVAADVVDLGSFDEFPDLGLFQVADLVLVGGVEGGDHAAVVAGDDDAAAAGGVGGVDKVFGAQAGGGAGVAEGLGVFVLADAADVEDGFGGEDVLGMWLGRDGLMAELGNGIENRGE